MKITNRIKNWVLDRIFIGKATGCVFVSSLNGEKRINGFKRYIHDWDTLVVFPNRKRELDKTYKEYNHCKEDTHVRDTEVEKALDVAIEALKFYGDKATFTRKEWIGKGLHDSKLVEKIYYFDGIPMWIRAESALGTIAKLKEGFK